MNLRYHDNGSQIICELCHPFHSSSVVGDEDHPFTYTRSEEQAFQVYSYLRTLSESGVPFYTKDAMRDLHEQTKDRNRDIFTVRGLDGPIVRFRNDTGKVSSITDAPLWVDLELASNHAEADQIRSAPFIGYETVESLLDDSELCCYNEQEYCSPQPTHSSVRLRRLSPRRAFYAAHQ